jgi:hypothetical protein
MHHKILIHLSKTFAVVEPKQRFGGQCYSRGLKGGGALCKSVSLFRVIPEAKVLLED